jgi:ABC-2 type transport system permease protein/oleandomycin transport system permease protein
MSLHVRAPGRRTAALTRIGTRIGHFFEDSATLAWRNLLHWTRVPSLIIFGLVEPAMFVLLFVGIFAGAILLPEGVTRYVDFLLPGVMVQVVFWGTGQSAVGLAYDLSRGLVDRFRSLPMEAGAVLLGRALADSVRNSAAVTVALLFGLIVGYQPGGSIPGLVAGMAVAVLMGFAASWISISIGLLVRDAESADAANFLWLLPITFLSSAFVPVETMPVWLQWFAAHQPVTAAIDAARYLTLGPIAGAGPEDILLAFAWIVLILAVAAPTAAWLYRRGT